jgi:hypothetical protein
MERRTFLAGTGVALLAAPLAIEPSNEPLQRTAARLLGPATERDRSAYWRQVGSARAAKAKGTATNATTREKVSSE